MISALRPVGNTIKLKSMGASDLLFAPFRYIGYQSGTAALAAAILAAKARRPELMHPEVLLPAYTCPDVIAACQFARVTPVLVDMEPMRPWLALSDLSKKLSHNSVAVIAINFLGICERIDHIRQLCSESEVDALIIEDSSQGMPTANFSDYWKGDCVVTSFGRGKPLGLFGGGALLYQQSEWLDLLPKVSRSKSSWYQRELFRLKVKMYNVLSHSLLYGLLLKIPQLKLGDTQFKPLDAIEPMAEYTDDYLTHMFICYRKLTNRHRDYRRMLASLNCNAIVDLALVCGMSQDTPLLRFPILITDNELKQRIQRALVKQGLGCSAMYQKILPDIHGVRISSSNNKNAFPQARQFAEQLITLPTHDAVTDKVLNKIENVLREQISTATASYQRPVSE